MRTEVSFPRRSFLLTFLILGALIVGAVLAVYQEQFREYVSMVTMTEEADLKAQEDLIFRRFDDIVTDVLFLTRVDCLKKGLVSGDFSEAVQTFQLFAESKKRYAQIRFLDDIGRERIRINTQDGASRPVPADALQDKSDRYYFQDSIGLPDGAIYVSPLDLNIENGVVEEPRHPMIRFASPVYADHALKGVLIINYSAGLFLDRIKDMGSRNLGDFYLLNAEGYYLASPDEDFNWGFMYPDRTALRFDKEFPEIWGSASFGTGHSFRSDRGVVSSLEIHPMAGLDITGTDDAWIAVSIVDAADLREGFRNLRGRLFGLGVFLFLFSALPAWALSQVLDRRRRQRMELYISANYDELTGLPNRHLGMDRLKQMVLYCRRYRSAGAVFFIDLDGFKAVNDEHGHDAGDELLKLVGRRLADNIRESDTAARFGGDEFFLVTPAKPDSNNPEYLAKKIISVLGEPYLLPGIEVRIGASVGIRHITGAPGEDVEGLIKDADEAMYTAKNEGKGRYSVFPSASTT